MKQPWFILCLALAFAAQANAAEPTSAPAPGDLTVSYDQPATHFTQSLPLGNGRLGALVFGSPSEDRIVLNEISLWSGAPQDADRPEAHQHLAEIQRLLKAGKHAEAQKLVLDNFMCKGPGSGQGSGAMCPTAVTRFSATCGSRFHQHQRIKPLQPPDLTAASSISPRRSRESHTLVTEFVSRVKYSRARPTR